MPQLTGSQLIYRSKGLTVRPIARGWESKLSLVYTRSFEFEVTQDEKRWFVGRILEFPGCSTQARTEAQLIERLQEALELALEESAEPLSKALFSTKR